jgi:hypothetical protein
LAAVADQSPVEADAADEADDEPAKVTAESEAESEGAPADETADEVEPAAPSDADTPKPPSPGLRNRRPMGKTRGVVVNRRRGSGGVALSDD